MTTNRVVMSAISGAGLSAHLFTIAGAPSGAKITRCRVTAKFTFPNQQNLSSYTVIACIGHALQVGPTGTPPTPWYTTATDPSIMRFDMLEPPLTRYITWPGAGADVNVDGGEFVGTLEWQGQMATTAATSFYYAAQTITNSTFTWQVFITGSLWYAT